MALYLAYIRAFYMVYVLTFYLEQILALTGILCGISSDILLKALFLTFFLVCFPTVYYLEDVLAFSRAMYIWAFYLA